jgi:hypothetical protein
VVDNSDSFFSGLPQLFKSKDSKAISKLSQYRSNNLENQLQKLKEKKAMMDSKISLIGEKMKEETKKE